MFSIFEKKVSFIAYSDFIPWYYWRGLEQTLFRLFVFVFVLSSPRNCFSSSCVLLFRNMHGGEHVLVEVPVVCVCFSDPPQSSSQCYAHDYTTFCAYMYRKIPRRGEAGLRYTDKLNELPSEWSNSSSGGSSLISGTVRYAEIVTCRTSAS